MARGSAAGRAPVAMREVDADADLDGLWDDVVEAMGAESSAGDRLRARWMGEWRAATLRVAAIRDDEVIGVVAVDLQDTGPWVDRGRRSGRSAVITLLHVRTTERRRGIGTALLAEALRFAERSGAEHVAVDVPPAAGRTQRFYARLGFAPVTTRRVAGIGALRRRIAGNDPIPRRRLLRRRSVPPEPDTGSL